MRVLRLALVLAIALQAIVVADAGASNFSGANGLTGCAGGSPVNKADNKDHYFFYENLTTAVAAAQSWTRSNVFDPTVINTHTSAAKSSTTDVIVRDQDYSTYCGYSWHPGSIWGLTTCNTINVANECEQHSVRYDLSYFAAATTTQERGLACHETGHSLGLTHRNTDNRCMKQYGPYPTALSSHDVAHFGAV